MKKNEICCSRGCKTLRTDTAAHCKRKGVREEDWAALDLKTLLSGQEGPGIDASAILIRHQRRLTAERRSWTWSSGLASQLTQAFGNERPSD